MAKIKLHSRYTVPQAQARVEEATARMREVEQRQAAAKAALTAAVDRFLAGDVSDAAKEAARAASAEERAADEAYYTASTLLTAAVGDLRHARDVAEHPYIDSRAFWSRY